MSNTIARETHRGTTFEIREVDENAWKAFVITRDGDLFVIDYAPADAKAGADPVTGAPTIAMVRQAWRDDRQAFRRVGAA
jgi:predicted Ser/Thr protein kinase